MNSYNDFITFVGDRAGHDRRYAIDATKIEKELGWKADENFERWSLDGIKALVGLMETFAAEKQ